MRTNLYLNIICTVIAVELLLLFLKPSPVETVTGINEPPASATQVRYNIPNASVEQPEPMSVKIVGIELPALKTNRNAVPVLVYNPTIYDGKVKEIPLIVKTQSSVK